jgi:uncharacterized protein (TIGR03437 family)
MRLQGHLALALALTSIPAVAASTGSPVFGSTVAIGGAASDIALDESRGVLYIANFGANVIDIMSTSDNTIHSSMNVLPWPGAIALSFDDQYLLVAHYCNTPAPGSSGPTQTAPPCSNALTSIHLADNSRQVFSLASPPLGVAFLGSGQALVVTTTNILLIDPATGQIQLVDTIANVGQTIPAPLASFPGQIVQASLTSSADGKSVWGIASAGTPSQLLFQYFGATNSISGSIYTSSPLLLPRISSAADGSYATIGYMLVGPGAVLKGRYPNTIASTNITGSVIDSVNGLIYAQYPDANQPTGPSASNPSGYSGPSAMLILDSDNLTFRDRISIPENMVGRAVLNAAATTMYAISDSGVMVLPVGSLNTYHRIAATTEDLLVVTNFCNSAVLSQSLTITDPGGGQTDFAIAASQPGVTIVPAAGTTPATVQVLIDPTIIPGSGGTTAVTLNLTSQSAVNKPRPVRLLINNPDPSQRGAIIDQPGVLSDILPDPVRNRVYVLRQDMNELLVFDGGSMGLIATLRTATSPTMMAMTIDGNLLLVGHDDSEFVNVYDLNALKPLAPLVMPGGHFARSIAVSNSAILVLARNEGNVPPGMVDSINLASGEISPLPTLGVYQNAVSATGVLASAPSGGNILLASPDGNVMLYTASANSFVASRHDFSALSGAFAASDYGSYVVGNSILDASVVPSGSVSQSTNPTSGFTFVDSGGYLASAASASAAGAMLRLNSMQGGNAAPLLIAEAPLLPTTDNSNAAAGWGTYGSGSMSIHAATSFARTVAPLASAGTVVLLSTSGLTVLPYNYSTGAPSASISGIVSAADGTSAVAPGGLITIYGQNMSPSSVAAGSIPLSTALGNSCLGVNGQPIPLLYVSPQQMNAQLPFNISGSATLTVHTPGGSSNNYNFTVQQTAPSIFVGNASGTEIATVVRNNNNQLVTPTNPIHQKAKDAITIYLTGMGATSPSIQAGQPAPGKPLAVAAVQPTVTLGGADLSVSYAGLVPGETGVYQINAAVPSFVPTGLSVPLVISQGSGSTTVYLRVVE